MSLWNTCSIKIGKRENLLGGFLYKGWGIIKRYGYKGSRCVVRGIPAGYSDGKRPPFRAKPATDSDEKAAAFWPSVGKVAGMARKITE